MLLQRRRMWHVQTYILNCCDKITFDVPLSVERRMLEKVLRVCTANLPKAHMTVKFIASSSNTATWYSRVHFAQPQKRSVCICCVGDQPTLSFHHSRQRRSIFLLCLRRATTTTTKGGLPECSAVHWDVGRSAAAVHCFSFLFFSLAKLGWNFSCKKDLTCKEYCIRYVFCWQHLCYGRLPFSFFSGLPLFWSILSVLFDTSCKQTLRVTDSTEPCW